MGATGDNARALGIELTRARNERKLTQRGLATKAGLSAKSAGSISRLEKGMGGIPHRSTLERYLRALDLDERRSRELMTLAGYGDAPTPVSDWDAVVRLLAECRDPQLPRRLDLGPLGQESLSAEEDRVLERFEVVDAALTLLRVAARARDEDELARLRSSALPYGLGISLLGADDLLDEDQRLRWEGGLHLALTSGVPIIEVFDLRQDGAYALHVVTKVLMRLATMPEADYQTRYFVTPPSRRTTDDLLIAPGLAGLMLLDSRDAGFAGFPDLAFTFRAAQHGSTGRSDRLTALEGQFERIRHRESKRLLRTLSWSWNAESREGQAEKALEWETELAYDEESEGDRFQVKRGLSRVLIPHGLWLQRVREVWRGNREMLDRLDRYSTCRRRRQQAFESQLGRFSHRSVATKSAVEALVDRGDATRLDDMLAGPDKVPLPPGMVRKVLEKLLESLDRGYELALLDDREASQVPIFEWAVKDRKAVYLEVHARGSLLRIVLQPETLVQVFRAYFSDFWHGLPVAARNQRQVQQYLREQLGRVDRAGTQ